MFFYLPRCGQPLSPLSSSSPDSRLDPGARRLPLDTIINIKFLKPMKESHSAWFNLNLNWQSQFIVACSIAAIALPSLFTMSSCHLVTLQHCRHCSCLPCHWAPRRHSKRPATSWRRWSSLALFFHPRIGSLSNTVRRFFPWMGGRGGTPQVLQKTGIFCPKTLFLAVLICFWSF